MSEWRELGGINEAYALELYERFLADPASVDAATREAFERSGPPLIAPPLGERDGGPVPVRPQGHRRRRQPRRVHPPLRPPRRHSSTRSGRRRLATRRCTLKRTASPRPICGRCRPASSAARWPRARPMPARPSRGCARSIARASATTSRTSSCPRSASWLRHAIEAGTFRAPHQPVEAVELLDRITEVETFERFLHSTFVGKTRFSIEGLDMMVPDPRRAHRRLGRGRRQARAHRHGASRPAQRARARDAEELRADSRRVQGSDRRPAVPRRPRLDGRREIPRRRPRARARGVGAGSRRSRCRRTRATSSS